MSLQKPKAILWLLLIFNILSTSLTASPVQLVVMENGNKTVYLYADIHFLETPEQCHSKFQALFKKLKTLQKSKQEYGILVEGLEDNCQTKKPSCQSTPLEQLFNKPSLNSLDFLNPFQVLKDNSHLLPHIQIKNIDTESRSLWVKINVGLFNLHMALQTLINYATQEDTGILVNKKPEDLIFSKDIHEYLRKIAKQRIAEPNQPIIVSLEKMLGTGCFKETSSLSFKKLEDTIQKELSVFKSPPIQTLKQSGKFDDGFGGDMFEYMHNQVLENLKHLKKQLLDVGFTQKEISTIPLVSLLLKGFLIEGEFAEEEQPKTSVLLDMFSDSDRHLGHIMEINALDYICSTQTPPNVLVFAGAYHTMVLESHLKQAEFVRTFFVQAQTTNGTLCKNYAEICEACGNNTLKPLAPKVFNLIK